MSNFWNSFPGVLTGIAAIITALAGIKVFNPTPTPPGEISQTPQPTVKPTLTPDSKHKHNIKDAVIKYLDVLEEAYEKNNINILKTAMSGDALDSHTTQISQNINNRLYYVITHRNPELLNHKVNSDELTAEAKITSVYKSFEHRFMSDGRCITRIPETTVVLNMVLTNDNDDWIVERSGTYRSNLSNQTKRCN